MTVIDINIDAGESYGAWRMGDDAGTFPYATSVNLACGFHGGDPASMFAAARLAMEHGLAIGAHPGLPDLVGFGRRRLDVTPDQAYNDVVYQIGALQGVLGVLGGNAAPRQAARCVLDARRRRIPAVADGVLRAVHDIDPALPLICTAASQLERAAAAIGHPSVARGLPRARLRARRAARAARHPGRRHHRRGRGGAPRGAHGGRGQGGRDRRHAVSFARARSASTATTRTPRASPPRCGAALEAAGVELAAF